MKVFAKSAALARMLKHPVGNIGFIDANTSAEWPDDSFTHRRLIDGDITTEAPKAGAPGTIKPTDGKESV